MTTTAPPYDRPLRVVSVSRGSSTRDARLQIELLGRTVILERRGVDGDLRAAARLYRELAPEVDAFGLGGADLFVTVGGRRYWIRESVALARNAGDVPVVCGAGLKNVLERRVVRDLDATVGWRGRRALVASVADRHGMAEGLEERGAQVIAGDLMFLAGVPWPLQGVRALDRVAGLVAPIMVRLPFRWLYPTGAKQEDHVADWRTRHLERADVLAGDFHFLRRHLPQDLRGKIVLTNTTTAEDLQLLGARGAETVITTTPRVDGRSLPTNLLEAALVAVTGRHPLPPQDVEAALDAARLEPDVWQARDLPAATQR